MNCKLSKKGVFSWLIRCLQGAVIGAGAILPGVSGGVLCVAFGIYEPMMALLSHPIRSFRLYYRLFVPFLIGWLAGFLLLAGAVSALFEAASFAALALFVGLVFGTLPELIKKSEQSDSQCGWSAFVIPMAVMFVLLSVLGNDTAGSIAPNGLWYIFCGAVWGLSIVLPGLSSSTILIYIGLYQAMTAGISQLDPAVIMPLLLGVCFTVLLSARVVNHLLETRYAQMSRFVLGVIIPPTLMILPTSFQGVQSIILAVVCFAGGFCLARGMDVIGKRLAGKNNSEAKGVDEQ